MNFISFLMFFEDNNAVNLKKNKSNFKNILMEFLIFK